MTQTDTYTNPMTSPDNYLHIFGYDETPMGTVIFNDFVRKAVSVANKHLRWERADYYRNKKVPVCTRAQVEIIVNEISKLMDLKYRYVPNEIDAGYYIWFDEKNLGCLSINFDYKIGNPDGVNLSTAKLVYAETFDTKPIIDILNKNTDEAPDEKGTVYMMMTTGEGISFRSLPSKIRDPFIRDNYSDEVLATYDRVRDDLKSEEPKGRIGIFDGPPGTGKTHLLRGLLTEVEPDHTTFVMVSPDTVSQLSGPSILPSLISFLQQRGTSVTFLIEDADDLLVPREIGNMSGISALLNLGDGIVGELLDIRIILTTNAKRTTFDAALTRPGRLSACIKVGNLPPEKVNKIYERLTGKPGEFGEMSLAEIYQKAFDSGFMSDVKPVTTRKIGFGNE